jgi:hypothetical protein
MAGLSDIHHDLCLAFALMITENVPDGSSR